jgi:hypothetical protein
MHQSEEARAVRAVYTDSTVTVYQAYSPQIADAALHAGTFVEPFKRDRMTWIKPSFLWMMYRSGWASKANQERVLAVELSRVGFEWALENSSLSHYDPKVHPGIDEWRKEKDASPVRVQWDPERSIRLERESRRAIQIGLSAEAVDQYLEEWIVSISDVTALAHGIEADVRENRCEQARTKLPRELSYPLPASICRRIGADPTAERPRAPRPS